MWRSVVTKYGDSLTIGELLLLTEAARCADTCDRLHTASERSQFSKSILCELRQQQLTLAALVKALEI
ncbi:hypothetical protein CIW52_06425 [Mycolicibacterium sp. P9-64]|nr:hypothetical protein CIW52_06425 [Mycolicibacterium sp. P9-64]